jgi:hypothetical protein
MPTANSSSSRQDFATRRNRVALPEQLNRRLNAYALAAGAAGVAVLACAMPAEAEPICKEFSARLTHTNNFPLYLTRPAVAPFNIAQVTNSTFRSRTTTGIGTLQWWNRAFFTPNTSGAKVLLSNGLPANLASGAAIGPGGDFGPRNSSGLLFTYGKGEYSYRGGGGTKLKHKGNLNLTQTDYVGFQFKDPVGVHYGWARLSVSFESGRGKTQHTIVDITGFGYESVADTAIAAGGCSESSTLPTSADATLTPKASGSLGLLALGNEGLSRSR